VIFARWSYGAGTSSSAPPGLAGLLRIVRRRRKRQKQAAPLAAAPRADVPRASAPCSHITARLFPPDFLDNLLRLKRLRATIPWPFGAAPPRKLPRGPADTQITAHPSTPAVLDHLVQRKRQVGWYVEAVDPDDE
jgi:hypothetical protein